MYTFRNEFRVHTRLVNIINLTLVTKKSKFGGQNLDIYSILTLKTVFLAPNTVIVDSEPIEVCIRSGMSSESTLGW